jgi:hypothetical protein
MKPRPGLQIMLRGAAYELLYQVGFRRWMARPLFVDEPLREVTIEDHDVMKPLHTQRPKAA